MKAQRLSDVWLVRHRLPTTRRNDPCPCGSGNKVKHCYGPREGARSPANRG